LLHNVPLHSHPDYIEQFNKIQEVFQHLKKSCAKATIGFKETNAEIDNKESSPVHNQKSVESDVVMTDGDIRNPTEGNIQEKSVANQEDHKDNKESFPMHNQKSVQK